MLNAIRYIFNWPIPGQNVIDFIDIRLKENPVDHQRTLFSRMLRKLATNEFIEEMQTEYYEDLKKVLNKRIWTDQKIELRKLLISDLKSQFQNKIYLEKFKKGDRKILYEVNFMDLANNFDEYEKLSAYIELSWGIRNLLTRTVQQEFFCDFKENDYGAMIAVLYGQFYENLFTALLERKKDGVAGVTAMFIPHIKQSIEKLEQEVLSGQELIYPGAKELYEKNSEGKPDGGRQGTLRRNSENQ